MLLEQRRKGGKKLAGFFSRIFGKNNEAVEAVAKDIAETALFCGQAFVDNMAKDNNSNITSTSDSRAFATNEYLYFLLHYVNRIAFVVGGVAAQQKVCDDISLYACTRLAATLHEEFRTECMSMLLDGLNEAEREYSKCKRLSPEGDESLKGTLFWEASKRISASAGCGMDLANTTVATQLIIAALSSLKLEERIKILAGSK